jgi:hypothetical protein
LFKRTNKSTSEEESKPNFLSNEEIQPLLKEALIYFNKKTFGPDKLLEEYSNRYLKTEIEPLTDQDADARISELNTVIGTLLTYYPDIDQELKQIKATTMLSRAKQRQNTLDLLEKTIQEMEINNFVSEVDLYHQNIPHKDKMAGDITSKSIIHGLKNDVGDDIRQEFSELLNLHDNTQQIVKESVLNEKELKEQKVVNGTKEGAELENDRDSTRSIKQEDKEFLEYIENLGKRTSGRLTILNTHYQMLLLEVLQILEKDVDILKLRRILRQIEKNRYKINDMKIAKALDLGLQKLKEIGSIERL